MPDALLIEMLADRVQRLPTLPAVYNRVNSLMADPNSSAADIGQVITHDQVIAAKVLNVVNSSFYGFKQRIGTVTRAMTMIGFRELKDLILALTAMPALNAASTHPEFNETEFWTHAVGVASCARAAASLARLPEPDESFTAGLLHDVGKLAEYQFMTDEFMLAMHEAHRSNEPLAVVEMRRYGFSHAAVGAMLARKWQFPDALTEAIANHHAPAKSGRFRRETAVVHLADIFARAKLFGDCYDSRVPPLDMTAWDLVGLKPDQIENLMTCADAEFEKGQDFIRIIREG